VYCLLFLLAALDLLLRRAYLPVASANVVLLAWRLDVVAVLITASC
jgi:hypothetical protein